MMSEQSKKQKIKKIVIAIAILLLIGIGFIWYIFTIKFDDTASVKSAYTVNGLALIDEFKSNIDASNKKYTEQIITVNGRVAAIENADTTLNIKMIDSISGSYAIFAFQSNDLAKVKQLKEGDSISIKGSCSGGSYSDILQMHFINFKRCALN